MGIITKNEVTFQNVCNIFVKKFTKRKIIVVIIFTLLTSLFIWLLDDTEREKFRLRLARYATPMFIVDHRFQKSMEQKIYERSNNSKPGVVDDILTMKPPPYLPDFKNPCWYEKTSGALLRKRCLPYFYLIGVDKCGTTDLFTRMLHHPQILRTNAVNSKETHWWSWRRFGYDVFVNNSKIQHFEDYLKVFDSTSSRLNKKQVFGDGSPTYFWDFTGWPLIPQNKGKRNPEYLTPHCIHHLTPKSKFILILRNPIERLYSDYLFLFRKNISPESFHEGVMSALKLFNDCEKVHGTRLCLYNKTLHMHTYVRILIGLYGNYLLEWFDVFSTDQFLIIKTEEYKNDIAGHLEKVFKFLELDQLSNEHLKKISSGRHAFERSDDMKKIGAMLPTTRILLKQFYSRSRFKVNVILGDKRFIWE